jgi:hypothetical protein
VFLRNVELPCSAIPVDVEDEEVAGRSRVRAFKLRIELAFEVVKSRPIFASDECRISRYECIRRVYRREREKGKWRYMVSMWKAGVSRDQVWRNGRRLFRRRFRHPPRIGNRMTPSNSQSRVKVSAGRDLVSKSAMLLAEET